MSMYQQYYSSNIAYHVTKENRDQCLSLVVLVFGNFRRGMLMVSKYLQEPLTVREGSLGIKL